MNRCIIIGVLSTTLMLCPKVVLAQKEKKIVELTRGAKKTEVSWVKNSLVKNAGRNWTYGFPKFDYRQFNQSSFSQLDQRKKQVDAGHLLHHALKVKSQLFDTCQYQPIRNNSITNPIILKK